MAGVRGRLAREVGFRPPSLHRLYITKLLCCVKQDNSILYVTVTDRETDRQKGATLAATHY